MYNKCIYVYLLLTRYNKLKWALTKWNTLIQKTPDPHNKRNQSGYLFDIRSNEMLERYSTANHASAQFNTLASRATAWEASSVSATKPNWSVTNQNRQAKTYI